MAGRILETTIQSSAAANWEVRADTLTKGDPMINVSGKLLIECDECGVCRKQETSVPGGRI